MKKELIPWRKKHGTAPAARREDNPVEELHQRVNELFDSFFDTFNIGFRWPALTHDDESLAISPRVDISETDDEVRVTAELPGMDEKDIQVTLDDHVLVVRGEKKQAHEDKNRNYHLVERSFGSFQRAIALPAGVEQDQVKATFRKGVLSVSVPKAPAAKTQQKKIAISAE